MSIDDTTFRRLLAFSDPVGVLTVMAGFGPDRAADPQPVAPIEVRNQLKAVQQALADDGRDEQLRALERRLEELGDDLDGLLDPRGSGRGRALYVGLGTGQREHVSVQVPFDERVVVRDGPFLRPLVAALDEGRPAGIVVPDKSRVRVLEWSLGATRELASMDFELTDAQLADRRGGPVEANPARGQQSASHREAFEDRVDENRRRFLKQAADTIGGMVRERGWDRLVVAGSPRTREELADLAESDHGPEVLRADASWENLSPAQVADAAWPFLRSVHRQRERELVEHAKERALSGGAGAVGLGPVCDAANLGRIDHLLFAGDAQAEGVVAEDDTLHAEIGGPLAESNLSTTPEPHLIERLVERVLRMGGKVTRVDDDEAALALEAHQGVAALLRW